jgi:AcrR family transcriptional regulator
VHARPRPVAHDLPRYSPDSRRELLLDAARSTFVRHGYAQSRTKDIADLAGVAEGLVFKYFGSKESLFEHAILEPLQRAVAVMVSAAESFEIIEPSQRRQQSEKFHQQMLEAMIEVAPLLGLALFSEHAKGRDFYQQHVWPLVEAMTDAANRALSPLVAKRIDPQVVAVVMSGAYFCFGIDTHLGQGPMNSAEFAQQMTRLLISGTGRGDPQPT